MGSEHAEAEAGRAAERPVVQELWFMATMAAVALLLMAIALGVALHKVLKKAPLTRERPPLVAMHKNSPMAVYPAGNSVLFDTAGVVSSVTLKSFTVKMEEALESKSACEEGGGGGGTSLSRSISQPTDRKSLAEAFGHVHVHLVPQQFMDDEEFADSVKGFSTVRKEHTMFTDTNL